VGRTARADAKGDAFTFVSPNEEGDLRGIERHIGQRLPRQKVSGFDYDSKPEEQFEVPLAERIAAIRARKAEDRTRAKANAERRAARPGAAAPAPSGPRPHARPESRRPADKTPGDGSPFDRGSRRPPARSSDSRPAGQAGRFPKRDSTRPAAASSKANHSPAPRQGEEQQDHRFERPAARAHRPWTSQPERSDAAPHSSQGREPSSKPRPRIYGHTDAHAPNPAPAHYPRSGNHPSGKDKSGKKGR
jgi:superfamily II DNA/RNA helicase